MPCPLASRLDDAGWRVTGPSTSDVVIVNTCGFIESASKDSVDTLLALSESDAKVVAVGCMAERFGRELADAMPEADAILSFDDYPEIGHRLNDLMRGRDVPAHAPRDHRSLSVHRPAYRVRHRLDGGPVASVALSTGCDRSCSLCAIPSFRGGFVSRHPSEIVAEARWLATQGVRELVLVSENCTAYGKDLPRKLGGLERARLDATERVTRLGQLADELYALWSYMTANWPPSMTSSAPWMKVASSEARKA